ERKKNGLRNPRDKKSGPDNPHQPRQSAPLHAFTFNRWLVSAQQHHRGRAAPSLISPSCPWTVVTGNRHKSDSSETIHRPAVCAAIVPVETPSSDVASASTCPCSPGWCSAGRTGVG